jgi:hypothetical protein
MAYDILLWGENPTYGNVCGAWPKYGLVGTHYLPGPGTSPDDYEPDIRPALKLKREDDEILIILSAIIKEL